VLVKKVKFHVAATIFTFFLENYVALLPFSGKLPTHLHFISCSISLFTVLLEVISAPFCLLAQEI